MIEHNWYVKDKMIIYFNDNHFIHPDGTTDGPYTSFTEAKKYLMNYWRNKEVEAKATFEAVSALRRQDTNRPNNE